MTLVDDIRARGFGRALPAGSRPALVVIDMSYGFTDPASPLACELESVVDAIAQLLSAARAQGAGTVPVVFTTVSYGEAEKPVARAFIEKVPALLTLAEGSRWVQIDARLAPRPGEALVNKLFASAFYGTALGSLLASAGCDTLIVTGASTSGCVRATVVDAIQHGYRPIVPREAVGDRDPAAHDANLHDIALKYGEVVPLRDALAVLGQVTGVAGR
jgi:maleamate amidohydrolase